MISIRKYFPVSKLVSLEREKIENEYAELMKTIAHLNEVLADIGMILAIIKAELNEVKSKYGDARRSEIIEDEGDVEIEDLIPNDDVVVRVGGEPPTAFLDKIGVQRVVKELAIGGGSAAAR